MKKLKMTLLLCTLSLISVYASDKSCEDFIKYKDVKKSLSENSKCFYKKNHLVILSNISDKTHLTVFNISRFEKDLPFPLVYKEEFFGKISPIFNGEKKSLIIIDNINDDKYDELAISMQYDGHKKLMIYTLNPKGEEYFGKLFFNKKSVGIDKFFISVSKDHDFIFKDQKIEVVNAEKVIEVYKSTAYGFITD